jgi:predicted O-methyltransferase YrrM
MSKLTDWAKGLARTVWFRDGTRRRCLAGPYAGLVFEIGPQMQMRMIVFYAAYEPEVSELLRRIVRPGMVLYDVGAHVGIHALYMAKLLKRSGSVYAFEAWPENYAVLERNIAHNPGLAEIVPLLGAVGDRDGIASVSRGANDG